MRGVIKMKRRWQVFISLVLSAFLVFSSAGANEIGSPPAPKLVENVLVENPTEPTQGIGSWFLGENPEKLDNKRPPIVFIHGIHGFPHDWWGETRYYGENEMYNLAHEQGYRTAFVQLYDKENGANDQWKNGKILSQMLAKIYKHFGQKVNVVAHSKGGIDTQAALVYNDAYRYVNKVIMIASPQQGCYLADLAYSWYMGWLGDLLGVKDDGSFALQTAKMAEFRKETDSQENVKKNSYYTVSGTWWGPLGTALWLGGYYLYQFGDNDGMITEESTHLPYAEHIATLQADHDLIRKGSTLFPVIEPLLQSADSTTNSNVTPPGKEFHQDAAPSQVEQYVNGGELKPGKRVDITVSVDSLMNEVLFNVMTKSPKVNVTLISPSGKTYTKASPVYLSSTGTDFFDKAAMQSYRIKKAEIGAWKVRLVSKEKDAFFLTSIFKGSSTYSVKLPYQSMKKEVPLEIRLNDIHHFDAKTMSVSMKVLESNHADIRTHSFEAQLQPSTIRGHYCGHIQGVTKSGLYNVTIEIKGKTKEGIPYQRSIIRSVNIGNLPSR
jgi:pimeloyl-ACP methyl ester carboxylesterase